MPSSVRIFFPNLGVVLVAKVVVGLYVVGLRDRIVNILEYIFMILPRIFFPWSVFESANIVSEWLP